MLKQLLNEAILRLKALSERETIDLELEEVLEVLTDLTAQLCSTPIAPIGMKEEMGRWGDEVQGGRGAGTPRGGVGAASSGAGGCSRTPELQSSPISFLDSSLQKVLEKLERTVLGAIATLSQQPEQLRQQLERTTHISEKQIRKNKPQKPWRTREKNISHLKASHLGWPYQTSHSRASLDDAIASWALIIDPHGTILEVNEKVARSLGQIKLKSVLLVYKQLARCDRLVGSCFYDFLPDQIAEATKERVQEVIRTGVPGRVEVSDNGSPKKLTANHSIYPVFDEGGKIARLAIFAGEEISEEFPGQSKELKVKSASVGAALPSCSAPLQHLFASSPALIYSCQPDGDRYWTFVSQNITTLLGYQPEEVLASPQFWVNRIHPDDAPRILDQLPQLFEKGTHTHEYRFRHVDGSYRWIHDEVRLIVDNDGIPQEIVGCGVDITERKLMEEALQKAAEDLEQRVSDRTSELAKANAALRCEIAARQQVEAELSEERERLLSLINAMPDLVFFKDGAGNLVEANQASQQMLGLVGVDYRGKTNAQLAQLCSFYRDTFLTCHETDEAAWRAQTPKHGEEVIPQPDGTVRILDVTKVPVFYPDGGRKGLVVLGRDITLAKQAEKEREKLASIVENSDDFIGIASLCGQVSYLNHAGRVLVGIDRSEEINTHTVFDIVAAENSSELNEQVLPAIRKNGHWEGELHFRNFKTQQLIPMLVHGFALKDPHTGEPMAVATISRDITERKRTEEQLQRAAFHDTLTGLPNRACFKDCLWRAVERSKRHSDYVFAVLFLDLDRFKLINDSLGHLIGDQLLIAIARRLTAACRKVDVVARLGGDEFAILLDDIEDLRDATGVAQRIHASLSTPFQLYGHEVFTNVSIGIALSRDSSSLPMSGRKDHSPGDLLRNADTAMYRAKTQGRNRYEVFDTTMHERAVALLQLENDLRRAFPSDKWQTHPKSRLSEFALHYQPIVSLDTGRLAGFEALVRWEHPERGLVSPAEFIPVAEDTGTILSIGQWILHEACRQLRQWQVAFPSDRPLTMNVNISGKQLAQPDLIKQIDQILKETGVNPSDFKLEITETGLMQNSEVAAELLAQLRLRNIGLCLDDFGTGYSSLSYLHRFPVNTLKIDRSFISLMGVEEENSELVRSIVTIANNLGMYAIAEGVETEEQLVQLRALQCEYGQGYFFSPPLPSEEAEALLAGAPQW